MLRLHTFFLGFLFLCLRRLLPAALLIGVVSTTTGSSTSMEFASYQAHISKPDVVTDIAKDLRWLPYSSQTHGLCT